MNRIFPFYGLAISILAVATIYLYQKQSDRKQFYLHAYSTIKHSSEALKSGIEMTTRNSRRENRPYLETMPEYKTAQILASTNQAFENSLNDKISNLLAKNRSKTPDSLWITWRALDSLMRPYDQDLDLTEQQISDRQSLFKSAHLNQCLLALTLLDVRSKIRQCSILVDMENRYKKILLYPNYGLLPVIQLEKNCIKAGELVKGSIFPARYSRYMDHINVWVDKKPMAFYDGIAPDKIICKGIKSQKIPVQVRFSNAAETDSFMRSNTIILSACQ